MKLWMRAVAVAGLAGCAVVFVWRGGAAASTEATCAPTTGFVLQFCVNVPGGQVARRDTTVPLYAVTTLGTDLRVEAGIPVTESLRVAGAVDDAALRVECIFGRSFS